MSDSTARSILLQAGKSSVRGLLHLRIQQEEVYSLCFSIHFISLTPPPLPRLPPGFRLLWKQLFGKHPCLLRNGDSSSFSCLQDRVSRLPPLSLPQDLISISLAWNALHYWAEVLPLLGRWENIFLETKKGRGTFCHIMKERGIVWGRGSGGKWGAPASPCGSPDCRSTSNS